jgi:hypothetical protein
LEAQGQIIITIKAICKWSSTICALLNAESCCHLKSHWQILTGDKRVWRIPETKDPVFFHLENASSDPSIELIILPSKQVAHSEVVNQEFHDACGNLNRGFNTEVWIMSKKEK